MGKEKKGNNWLAVIDKGKNLTLGQQILNDFEAIRKKARELSSDEPEKNREARIRLLRGYVSSLVTQYLYLRVEQQK